MRNKETKTDMARLMEDSMRFKGAMEDLMRDYQSWERDREAADLKYMIVQIKKIEGDITRFRGGMERFEVKKKDEDLSESLRHVFKITDALFQDVKNVRESFETAYIDPEMLRCMEIDWRRLEKTVEKLGNTCKVMESETALSFF